MKKLFLIISAMLFTLTSANAVEWTPIETGTDTRLYIDRDNIQYVAPDACYYSIMYQSPGKAPIVSFLKSNYANNTLGVIRNEDYEIQNYNPMYVFTSYQVFMRPVIENSFVLNAHKYVSCLYTDSAAATAYCQNKPFIKDTNIGIINSIKAQEQLKYDIAKNWILSPKGRDKTAIILVSVGERGALNSYNILKSTGSDLADRAIISAIELTAPFENIQNINLKLVFRSGLMKKIVE